MMSILNRNPAYFQGIDVPAADYQLRVPAIAVAYLGFGAVEVLDVDGFQFVRWLESKDS